MSFGVEIPFVELLGFELLQFEGGKSELAYAPKAEHLNSFSVTHGGALMTLLAKPAPKPPAPSNSSSASPPAPEAPLP